MSDTPVPSVPVAPAPQPAAAPPQPPAASGRGRFPVIAIVVVIVVLLGCCCAAVGTGLLVTLGGGGIPRQDWRLSDNQRAVLRDFGPPQTFAVLYAARRTDPTTDAPAPDEELVRFETWEYYDAGSQWYFEDGRLVDRKDLPVLKGTAGFPALRPERFHSGMSLDDVSEAIGAEPDSDVDLSFGEIEGLTGYGWGNGQVVAVMQDERLVSLKTCPVEKGGK